VSSGCLRKQAERANPESRTGFLVFHILTVRFARTSCVLSLGGIMNHEVAPPCAVAAGAAKGLARGSSMNVAPALRMQRLGIVAAIDGALPAERSAACGRSTA
jgi:hypothetical protein